MLDPLSLARQELDSAECELAGIRFELARRPRYLLSGRDADEQADLYHHAMIRVAEAKGRVTDLERQASVSAALAAPFDHEYHEGRE